MEVFLEQFIGSDKSKEKLKNVKVISAIIVLAGVWIFFMVSPPLALLIQIAAVIFYLVNHFSFIDYEYELFNGNIDVSKIYAGSRRKNAEKITVEAVEAVYESSNNINPKIALFNSNIKDLKIYTFEFKGSKNVQLALNEKLEEAVKIIYRSKIKEV